MDLDVGMQLREERRAAKAAAAADAKRTLRKETEWMRRQPKARSTKSTARIKQFYELTAKARDVPQAEVSVDFDGETKMKRQVRGPTSLPAPELHQSVVVPVLGYGTLSTGWHMIGIYCHDRACKHNRQ